MNIKLKFTKIHIRLFKTMCMIKKNLNLKRRFCIESSVNQLSVHSYCLILIILKYQILANYLAWLWHIILSLTMILDWSEFSSSSSLTLNPEDLMWTPLLVSVDFIRMKKERSRILSGDRRLGLFDSTAETNKHPITTKKQLPETARYQAALVSMVCNIFSLSFYHLLVDG